MDRKNRRGSTATTVALTLGVTLGFSAIAVDLGVAFLGRAEVQNALDAGTLGGVAYLDGTDLGVSTATSRASSLVAANKALGGAITVNSVTTGVVSAATGNQFLTSSNSAIINALRINGSKTGVVTPFAALMGTTSLNPTTESTSAQPPHTGLGKDACYLPLAVPDCILNDVAAYESKGFSFKSDGQDNTGWATMTSPANANTIKGQIAATDYCGTVGTASVGKDVYLNNGDMDAALNQMIDTVNASTLTWDANKKGNWGDLPLQSTGSKITNYGNIIQGPIIMFHDPNGSNDPTQCALNTKFNSNLPVTGFVWGVVYDVIKDGSDHNIRMKLDLTHDFTPTHGSGGGGDGNVTWQPPPVLFQ